MAQPPSFALAYSRVSGGSVETLVKVRSIRHLMYRKIGVRVAFSFTHSYPTYTPGISSPESIAKNLGYSVTFLRNASSRVSQAWCKHSTVLCS